MKTFIKIVISALLFLNAVPVLALDAFLANYERPITILEITDLQDFYTLQFAPRYKGVFVLLSQAEKVDTIKKRVQDFNNVILAHPKEFSTHSLVELASCEHFDVTMVHDWAMLQKKPLYCKRVVNFRRLSYHRCA